MTLITDHDTTASTGNTGGGVRLLDGVRRRPLLTFFVLSCLLSWWPALLGSSGGGLAGFGPFLAALVVLGITQGRGGVKDLLVRMVRWRVAPRHYLLALGVPAVLTGGAVALTLATGATAPSAASWSTWTQLPLILALMLIVPGMGGAWEEPGFRGYALGRLEARYGRFVAPLVLGLFWIVWHLPLFLIGAIRWSDTVVIVAVSVVIAAVYHSARESILIVMLLHATNNTVGGEFAGQLFAGADAARLGGFLAALWALLALVVVAVQRRRTRVGQARVSLNAETRLNASSTDSGSSCWESHRVSR